MKLSDVVAEFLASESINHVFAISGGASLHLIHSIAENPNTTFVCPQHEQGGAYAADGYSRATGRIGCAIATSGPGATNLITGIASAFYDSVPVLFITGQVATFRSKGNTGVRQMGFQETDMIELCKTVTKYAVLISDPYMIKFELQKALEIARSGRPGPVLIDIPDDLQRMDIDPELLKEYIPPKKVVGDLSSIHHIETIGKCLEAIKKANRPIIIYGWGVHLSGAESEALSFAEKTGIPVAMTWAGRDLFSEDHELNVGGFGTHGTRYANFAVQNADLIISVGSRLDTKATGSPPIYFAREAEIIMVDIDLNEIRKFESLNKKIDIEVVSDAKIFLQEINAHIDHKGNYDWWLGRIKDWKRKYPQCKPEYKYELSVNPYWFIKKLSELCDDNEIIFSDTGCSIAWLMQGFEFKKGQRFFHAFNNTPMGYALPGSIGACFARPNQRVLCVVGDGGFLMSIQELATAAYHKLPIKIILMNNYGHAMVRQTQDMWLAGNHYATSIDGGLPAPDFTSIARGFGFKADELDSGADIEPKLRMLLESEGPFLLNVMLEKDALVEPQVKFGKPNEDASPLLDRDEFLSNMIVSPIR